MKFSGYVVRTGVPLPPAAGPARLAMMRQEGTEALQESARLYGECCRSMAQTWGLDYSYIPSWETTTESIQRQGLHSIKSQQKFLIETWSRTRKRLRHEINRRSHASPLNIELPAMQTDRLDHRDYAVMAKVIDALTRKQNDVEPWQILESGARKSLVRAVDAFNFLEDTELRELAHRHAHEVAAFVGGIFGCGIEYSDGSYWDTCRLSLMHQRWGMSAGFTATRRCSLCKEDIDLCEHLLDTLYEVQVELSPDGTCSVCGRRSCLHGDGEIVLTYPHPVMDNFELHEVSLVRRPRDPLARISKLELNPDLLARTLGGNPDGRDIQCYRCLHPCEGFTSTPMG
ncbi:hypothetical protein PUR59_25235 [Streptomyces sp. SP18ES09]|uniref:hypothetical protein n=1 Tax=Streptomyces sp. SP18ES09 TaxID=3002532 RepID=UPI002E781916|nr:hypothetical protein [Streptomyces sp. SP18ES09]MEE1818308.1 hypothetical protein [Streptomyces sp. SP18ES09]